MLLKQTSLYLPAQIIAPVVQLLSVLIWAHLLPVDEVGKITLIVAIQEILFAGLFMWWSHFMLRYLPRYASADQRLSFRQAELPTVLILAVTQFGIMIVICHYYFEKPPTLLFYVSVSVYATVRSLTTYLSERARSDVRIVLYTALQAAFPAIGLAMSIVCTQYFSATAEYVLLAMTFPQLVGIFIAAARTDIGRNAGRPDIAVLKNAVSFGIPVTIGSVLAGLALNAPRFIVNHMLGIAATGIFAVSYGLGIRASSFAVMLVTAGAYPLVVRKMENEGLDSAYKQLAANMTLVALAVSPVACGLISINTSVIDTFLPQTMRETAYFLLPLSTLCGLFRYLRSHTTDQVFLIGAKPSYVTMIATVDLVLAIMLTFIGLSQFGLWGAVLGPLVTAIITWAASLLIAVLKFGFPFPSWRIFRIVGAAVMMMIVILELPTTTSPLSLAVQVACGSLIYMLSLFTLFPLICIDSARQFLVRMNEAKRGSRN